MDDSGFQKIDFDKKKSPEGKKHIPESLETNDTKMAKKSTPFFKKKLVFIPFSILVVLLVVVVGFGLFLWSKAQIILRDGQATYAQARLAYEQIKQQNIVGAKDGLIKTQDKLSVLSKDYEAISFLQYFPILSWYYNDGLHGMKASSYALSAGITVTDSLIPYADVLGLKGNKSFVGGSAEDRIQTAVKTLGKIVPNIDKIESNLVQARSEIDQIDPNHYPKIWKLSKVQSQLATVKSLTDQSVSAIEEAKPLIKVLPTLLGDPNPAQYMVLFQNDKELRPTGGFLTFYAIFGIDEGVIHVNSTSDMYNLDDSIPNHPSAPDIILKYLPKVYTANIRDSNLSPDFKVSMEAFNKLYARSTERTNVDGIIALDTEVLVHTLNVLGDVQVDGQTFTAQNDPRCDCPQVVYVLEQNADQPVGYVRTDRKALVGDLLYAIMRKALQSSPSQYWGKLMQQALTDAQQKHILFYLYNKDAQSGIEALNFGGRIKDFNGDYLHINDANFAGAKSNMYTTQSVKMEYNIDSSGKITKTLTIDYVNNHAASDCNPEHGKLCLNAILRDYLRVYVPKGSTLTDQVVGSEVKVGTKEDLGKTYFDGFLTVRPLGHSEIVFKYQLPFYLQKGSRLPVMIQKQPGTDNVQYDIYVNGNKEDSFILDTDKTLNLKV